MLRRLIEQAFSGADPRSLHTHVGLWIDKMLVAEEPSSHVSGPHLRKIEQAPVPDGYALGFATRRALLESASDRGECLLFEAKTTSRLVVGLGAKGVLEMGLTLDHTWGTPYIPGSALKGICAATAHRLVEGEGWRKPQGWPEAPPADPDKLTDYQMLFGTTANEGVVVFHDAWWDPTGETDLPILMDDGPSPRVLSARHQRTDRLRRAGAGAVPERERIVPGRGGGSPGMVRGGEDAAGEGAPGARRRGQDVVGVRSTDADPHRLGAGAPW